MKKIRRRTFLAGTATITLGSMTARSRVRVLGANDRVRLGFIGVGGRGRSLMGSFKKNPDVELVAICDVYEPNRRRALEIAGNEAKPQLEYRELLDSKEIDAVAIATPDHWHHDMLLDAVNAGKDVYLEKPMSYSVEQGANMVRAVRKTRQIVQIGMQRRSSEAVRKAKTLVEEGVLGEIVLARAHWYWNQAPISKNVKLEGELDWERFQKPAKHLRPMEPIRFRSWRNFWDYSGGHCTDQGTHLMDVIQWFTSDSKPPRSAQMSGARYQHLIAEVPDTFSAVYEYPSFIATWTLSYANSFHDGWMITLQGKKGTMELDDDGFRVYPEPWPRGRGKGSVQPSMDFKGQIPTEPHVRNFLDCVKSRQEPNAPVEVGHAAVTAPHMANVSLHSGKKAMLTEDGLKVIV